MGGRLIFERLSCAQPQECWSNAPFYPNHVYCEPKQYDIYVRINVNDGIVPLSGCDSGPGSSCPLAEFLDRVERRGQTTAKFGDICGLREDAPQQISFLHQ
jgi:acid phosphatase